MSGSSAFSPMHVPMCVAIIALLASAVSSEPIQLQQQRFNYSSCCNGSSFDSLHSSPNGTHCFNARQEFVGVTDWFLTGELVYSQFRNMDSRPFQCKVKLMADPAESWSSFESGWYTIKSAAQSVWTEWTVTLLDWPGAVNWIDSGVVLSSARAIDFVKFALVGQLSCVRNVMVACNSGASGGALGATAMSLGKGYWEHHLGTLGIPWENCGPDGMGVRAKQSNDFSFHFTPWAMSGDWDRFWKAVYVVLEPARATVTSINTSCFTSSSGGPTIGLPKGRCTTEEEVSFIFGFEEWKMDGGAEAVLLLVCGLPGAGKTTLARRVERGIETDSWRLQCLSFDELFRACADAKADEFDPVAWKRCQREMAERVRMWRASQAQIQSSSGNRKRLVLLVDDNFQYRSLRKRFAHLATEVDCGFGILHANTPLEICRSRNAARIGVERVPDAVFERMANAFEAPDSKQYLFERNTITLSLKDTQDTTVVSVKIAELMRNATKILQEKRKLAVIKDKETLQSTQDQMRMHRDVVHHVDLQLRKWISSVLQQQQEQQQDDVIPPNAKKAKTELAQRLNQTRKAFLSQLKPLIRGDQTSGDTASSEDVDAVVAVHIQCFKDQHQPF